jgi:flagellar hook capping protein
MAIQSVQNSLMNTMTSNVNNSNEKIVDSLGKEYKFADVTAESLKKKQAEEEAQKAEKAKRTGYDKDTFIKLFVAQMKNQDPMEPMKNEEYMTQMAQFTSVEQMSNMASSFEKFAKNFEEKGSFNTKLDEFLSEFKNTNKALLDKITSLENEIKTLKSK